MNNQRKRAKKITTIFTVSFILFPILLYCYSESKVWYSLLGFMAELCFVVLLVSGVVGTYMTHKVNRKITNDLVSKLIKSGYKVEELGFNEYRLNDEKRPYSVDLEADFSEMIQIDTEKRIIKYK